MTSNILVTGSTGFLGRHLVKSLLAESSVNLTATLRRFTEIPGAKVVQVQDLDANTDWAAAVGGQKIIIHAAARAHVMKDKATDPLAEYRRVNVDATVNFARQAAAAGVERFIFISSIGVNGNLNTRPFTEDVWPNPVELSAQAKWEAEQGLWEVQSATGMELVVIRPPLVYGADAPGNFGSLARWVEKGVPLPFGAIHNQRSLVALDNLVDLIITCIHHPAAANEIFLAGDGQDLSTTELLQGVAKAMGKPSRLIPVPESMLMLGATILGKRIVAQRLLGSLQVDISKTRNLLGWEPPITVEEGLRRCFDSQGK